MKGKVALVTGGSRGIGRAVVEALRGQGCQVAVMARQPEPSTCDLALTCDVGEEQQQLEAFSLLEKRFDRLDYAFINAGVVASAPLLEMEVAQWDEVLNTNLRGAFISMRESARRMVAAGHGGSILSCVSLTALLPGRMLGHYGSAKAGLAMLSRTAAQELGEHGIRVNAIAPGLVRTDLTAAAFEIPGYADAIRQRTPLGRIGEPEEVAEAVLALLDMEWLTGQVVALDGGLGERTGMDLMDILSSLPS